MSSLNSFIGYQNLPAQIIATTTDTPLLVPAQGLYSTLPSPTLAVGAGLYVGIPGDILNNAVYDGHPFTVRVAGKAFVAATASTFTPTIKLGNSNVSASNTALANLTKASASVTATNLNFWLTAEFIWDSVSQSLSGVATGIVGGQLLVPTVVTAQQVTNPTATTTPNFQFIPSFAFSVANAANSVTVTEFLIDRGV